MTERALVHEVQRGTAREVETHAQVGVGPAGLDLGRCRAHEELAAHPEVGHERVVRLRARDRVERKPQELAAADRCLEAPPGQSAGEVERPALVASHAVVAADVDGGHRAAQDVAREPVANRLDLRELRHDAARSRDWPDCSAQDGRSASSAL